MTTRGKECKHDGARRGGGPSIEGWLWCTGCRAEIRRDDDGVWRQKPDDADAEPTCTCVEIMQADETRHFRGCPLREKYPDHPAAHETPEQLVEAIDRSKGNDWAKPDARTCAERFEKLEKTVKSLADRTPSNLVGRLDALEKATVLTQGYTCMTCGDGDVKPGCIANHDVRPHDVVKQLEARVAQLEKFDGVSLIDRMRATAAERADTRARYDDAVKETVAEARALGIPVGPDVFTKRDSQPTVVCLCGSTRFAKAFADAMLVETLAGRIVLSVGSMTHSDAHIKACIYCGQVDGSASVVTDLCTAHLDAANSGNAHEFWPLDSKHHIGTKGKLDTLHLRKIEMADEVLVLNCDRCVHCGVIDDTKGDCRRDGSLWSHNFQPYIGDSTRLEIKHAYKLGKRIRFLNPQPFHEDIKELWGYTDSAAAITESKR